MTTGLRRVGRLWRYDPGLLVAYGLAALFLLVFVVWPLARVALEPTVADWRQVFTTPRWQRAAGNTALMLVLSTTSSLLLGTLYAFAVTRAPELHGLAPHSGVGAVGDARRRPQDAAPWR